MTGVAIFGATSAIAQAVARLYAADSATFFLVARDSGRLATVAADLKARGAPTVTTAAADLADVATHAGLVAQAAAALGRVDRVLMAYGTLSNQAACAADAGVAVREIGINFVSTAALLTTIANLLEGQGTGRIAVIGSVAGDRGRQSNYVYGAAKAGLGVFVQGLRHRFAPTAISVTLVKPGFVDTPMTAAITKGGPLWATPDQVARDIHRAVERGAAVLYTPWFWRWIMLIIRTLPDVIFARVRL